MNEELYHYGVQGMKWGRRKDPERTGFVGRRRMRTSRDPRQSMAPEQIRRKNTRAAIGVGAGALALGGAAAVVTNVLLNHRNIKMPKLAFSPDQLRSMGIDAFEPTRINIDRIKF